MQLLRQGWSRAKSDPYRLRLAKSLIEQGVVFKGASPSEEAELAELVRREVPGMSSFDLASDVADLFVAVNAEGELIGGLVLSLAIHPGCGYQVAVRAVVVDERCRHEGVGSVLLGLIDQVVAAAVDEPVRAIVGTCPPELAKFYQRSGYTVLAPGEVLPAWRAAAPFAMKSTSEATPCYFVREF